MHPATQLRGRTSIVSLDAPCGAETETDGPRCLHECLAAQTEDPAMAALRHLDWEHLLPSLDATTREVLLCLMKGQDLITLVPLLKRSSSALGADKRRLARLVHEQLGADILARVQEQPRWSNNLEASRQNWPAVTNGRRLKNQRKSAPAGFLLAIKPTNRLPRQARADQLFWAL